MEKIDLNTEKRFLDVSFLQDDEELKREIQACVEARLALRDVLLKPSYRPHPEALREVSPDALEELLEKKQAVHNISERREISNVVSFNFSNIKGSIFRKDLLEQRLKLDRLVKDRLSRHFQDPSEWFLLNSGNFWYPPGGYMGWHTNENSPSWRFYINYCTEPGKSFFRFRDSSTGELKTSWDKQWNFRMFKVTAENPFWHSVYSQTDRFSFGYFINRKHIVKKRYKDMYTIGYESCDSSDCLQGYDWLAENYPEEYRTRFHRMRAHSTRNRLVWNVIRQAEKAQVLHRTKSLLSSLRGNGHVPPSLRDGGQAPLSLRDGVQSESKQSNGIASSDNSGATPRNDGKKEKQCRT